MYGRDPPTLTQRYVDHKSLELPLPEPIPEKKRKKKKRKSCAQQPNPQSTGRQHRLGGFLREAGKECIDSCNPPCPSPGGRCELSGCQFMCVDGYSITEGSASPGYRHVGGFCGKEVSDAAVYITGSADDDQRGSGTSGK